VPVSLTSSGWHIGSANLGPGEMVIEPGAEGSLGVGPPSRLQAYRGRYRLVPIAGDRFDVVNEVDVEGYLKGVIGREMFKTWHPEAYEAQAIVARTYALFEARNSGPGHHFDLYPDQRSQVYGGIAAESVKSRQAVDATRGIVVAYGPVGHEKIFKAYFSSCCGGITQSASDAFGDPPSEPLSDQSIGPRCVESPHFNWGPVIIQKIELTRRVRAWGAFHKRAEKELGEITRVDVQFVNRWGRPTRFVITDVRGTKYSLTGEEFRVAFNTNATDGITVSSSFFKPVNETDVVRLIDGHGFGHGVGLCQWCAEHEASQGVRPESIVVSAFPHSRLVRAY
jgi:stage II sporulation protein D